MKTLIIAEKPDMGRNIAAAIEPKAINKRTYIEGEQYLITWAIGHLLGLAEPEAYDTKYKRWIMTDLPIIPNTFKLVPNAKTKAQLKQIAELAKRSRLIINACDAGREGQYIFHLIQRHLKLSQPVKRLWISDLTPETIRRGFAELRDGAQFEHLTRAACARSEADWLVGMNASRAFTVKHGVLLSVGRVQTPVLALIYDRQKQIESFSSLTYYDVHAFFRQRDVVYRGVWQGERILERQAADAITGKTSGAAGRIQSYEVKVAKEQAPKLFDLTLLQREANGKYGFPAKKTLDLAQSLYEKHKAITYPRTNSNYVTEQNIVEMHRALDALRPTSYAGLVEGANKQLVHVNNRNVCKPSKVEDHHAILPTTKRPKQLTADEQKVYDLIVRRFLTHFYTAAEYKVHTILTDVCGEMFKTTVKQLLDLGWKIVYADHAKRREGTTEPANEDEIETDAPFQLDAQQSVHCERSEVIEKKTEPPKPYTEGTLLRAMESAGKHVEDEELREAMKDSGLGTPATRAATIERLKQVGFIEMKGKRIVITQKGRSAIEVIRSAGVSLLTSPEMTGMWERRLNEIARGEASDQAFLQKVKQFVTSIVDKVRMQPAAERVTFGEIGEQAKPSRARASLSRTARPAKSSASTKLSSDGTIGPCPREHCGGRIFMGRKGYGCTHFKSGCRFVIWKESYRKTLSDAMVRSLITKGKTNKLKFKSKDGKPYEAKIVLIDKETGKLELEF